jgi:hypothetical protein
MPQLIHPNQVKVTSVNGEVKVNITLDLNVNLPANLRAKQQIEEEENDDKVEIIVPTFSSANKLKFGKKEGV